MIITKLMGGLGNQMFQYAAARRMAHCTGSKLKFDTTFYSGQSKRQFRLDRLRIRGEVASDREIARFFPPRGRRDRLLRALSSAIRVRPIPRVLQEPHFHFDRLVLAARDETYLNGFWQSEKYFHDISPQLREELTPKLPPSEEAARLADEVAGGESVGIHLRRGDYVAEAHTAEVHGACPLEYYSAAVEKLAAHLKAPRFFVFSDSTEWSRENLRLRYPANFVALQHPDADVEEFWLMSRCRHHIIANSSYSWWAAWLNPRTDKQVLAPRRWFASGDRDTRDLIPPEWQLL